jgi:hypothetical protein
MLGLIVGRRMGSLRPDLQKKWEQLDDALDRASRRSNSLRTPMVPGFWMLAVTREEDQRTHRAGAAEPSR